MWFYRDVKRLDTLFTEEDEWQELRAVIIDTKYDLFSIKEPGPTLTFGSFRFRSAVGRRMAEISYDLIIVGFSLVPCLVEQTEKCRQRCFTALT